MNRSNKHNISLLSLFHYPFRSRKPQNFFLPGELGILLYCRGENLSCCCGDREDATDPCNEEGYCETTEISILCAVDTALGTKVFECAAGETEGWDIWDVAQD